MHSEAEVRAAVERAGCRVLELRKSQTEFGSYWYGKHACPTNPHTFKLLLEIARLDEGDPVARELGLRFFRQYPRDPKARAEAIHAWIKDAVWYIREPKETFQSPEYTVKSQAGDCDDHAILLNAIAKNAGLTSRIVPLRRPNGEVKHAVGQVMIDGLWSFAETTVDAEFGEAPYDAVRRLRLGGRGDMR